MVLITLCWLTAKAYNDIYVSICAGYVRLDVRVVPGKDCRFSGLMEVEWEL